jgi:hypothetical protein
MLRLGRPAVAIHQFSNLIEAICFSQKEDDILFLPWLKFQAAFNSNAGI